MANTLGKRFGTAPLFDPAEGMLVRAPLGDGPGWWAGAPSATFDAITNQFYLTYRLRQPRDQGRGIELRIASSENGVAFTDIWALPKGTLGALSLERASLMRGEDGIWRLYFSYVCPQDGLWRISLLEAEEPDGFDPDTIRTLLSAKDVGAEGVKDPNVFQFGKMIYMLASYATNEESLSPEELARRHATGDIYSTGLTRSRTGAAVSGDGKHFQWIGDVSPVSNFPLLTACSGESAPQKEPGEWDAYCRRIGALLPLETGGYLAFYDGSRSVEENYEEKTGLAITFDLKNYYSLSPVEAALISPHATNSLRYIDVLPVGHELFYYYEIAREDGAHELRVSVVERS